MAYLKTAAILTRIREVVTAAAGAARTIPAARFDGDLPDGLDPVEDMRRAMTVPRAEATTTDIRRHPASPPVTGNVLLYDVGVSVRVVRTVTRLEQLSDADRDAIRALAAQDADAVRQALEYPHNLDATTAGTSTGIVSGMCVWESSRATVTGRVNDGAQALSTIHNYRLTAIARP